jgi:sugar phosphate isomerase/epimerase
MKIGIVQGRISRAPIKKLQHFPKKWENEFVLARKLNLSFIEFFSERVFNKQNPIWCDHKIKKYLLLTKKNRLQILNFCDDYVINNDIRKIKTLEYLKKLKKQLIKLKIKNLILPLYKKSNIDNKNFRQFIKIIKKINLIFKNSKINIFIEANISAKTFDNINSNLKSKKFGFLYDTGNQFLIKNKDQYKEILLFGKNIKHVHIKDRNLNGKNVLLGTGKVNFSKIFSALKKIKYKKNFTLETPRGTSPCLSAKKNILFLKKKLKILK